MPSSSRSTHGGAASSPSLHGDNGDGDGSNTDKCTGNVNGGSSGRSGIPSELVKAAEIAVLSERLVLEMAEIFSPKELHVMALAHLPAYSGDRLVSCFLVKSTQTQREQFAKTYITHYKSKDLGSCAAVIMPIG